MKRARSFLLLLLSLIGGLCALGAPAGAADTFRFSNSGNWAARYVADSAKFVVYDYRRSPDEAAAVSDLTLDPPPWRRGPIG